MLEGSSETVAAPPMKSWGLSPFAVVSWESSYRVPMLKQTNSSDPGEGWRYQLCREGIGGLTSGFQVKFVCFVSLRKPIPHAYVLLAFLSRCRLFFA